MAKTVSLTPALRSLSGSEKAIQPLFQPTSWQSVPPELGQIGVLMTGFCTAAESGEAKSGSGYAYPGETPEQRAEREYLSKEDAARTIAETRAQKEELCC